MSIIADLLNNIQVRSLITAIILLILGHLSVTGQTYSIRKYYLSDGLPQTQVMNAFQDSRGFIWLCTKNGISRFDGETFINYYQKDGLPDSYARRAIEDNNGDIYVQTSSGFSKFTGFAFEFIPPPDSLQEFIYGAELDRQGTIWTLIKIGVNYEIISFKDGKYFSHTEISKALNAISPINFLKFDKKIEKLLIILENQKAYILADNFPELYTGKFDPESDDLQITDSAFVDLLRFWEYETPMGLIIDRDSTIWFTSEGGLMRLLSHAFINFTPSQGLANNIWSVVEDQQQNIWFSSLDQGLQKWDGERLATVRINLKGINRALFMGSKCISNGDIYFTNGTGVLKYSNNVFTTIDYVDNQCLYIYEYPFNTILFGTSNELVVNRDGDISKYPQFKQSGLGHVQGITYNRADSSYWLATSKSVVRFDGENIYNFPDSVVPKGYYISIDADSTGNIWVSGDEGLFFFDLSTGIFEQVFEEENNFPAKALKVMDKNSILVGRMEDIAIIDIDAYRGNETSFYTLFDKSKGFLGLECNDNGIIKDSKGYYWIISGNMVTRFDPSKVKHSQKAPLVYINSIDCLSDSLSWKRKKEFNLYDKQLEEYVELKHNENSLNINFSSVSTTYPGQVVYRCILSSRNKTSVQILQDKEVQFHQLKPGTYTLELFASSDGYLWNSDPAILRIFIKPAFWQTIWFTISLIISLLALAYFLTTSFINIKKKKEKVKRTILQEYSKIQISQIMKQFDPHFTMNAIASVGNKFIAGKNEEGYDQLVRVSNILRDLLFDHDQFTKTLAEELKFVKNYCEIQKEAMQGRFDYAISVDDKIDRDILIPKIIIQGFVENAVKHGIFHKKEGGRVDISVSDRGTHILISIRDNGLGREKARTISTAGTGKGEKLTRALFEHINNLSSEKYYYDIEDLYDNNRRAAGTVIKLTIPKKSKYFI